jgi:hypothetical protein
LHWLAPIYLRDNNMGKDRTWTVIAPALYTQRRKGENLDFVQFPLVWHIERGENQGTFGAFAWWDIRVRGKMFQTVPGAFFRWKTPEADTKVIGPGLGWWTKGTGAREGELHWRALFGVFGGGRAEGRKYISIFGARIDRGPAPGAETGPRQKLEPLPPKKAARLERRAQRLEARTDRRAARSDRRAARSDRRAARAGRSASVRSR